MVIGGLINIYENRLFLFSLQNKCAEQDQIYLAYLSNLRYWDSAVSREGE